MGHTHTFKGFFSRRLSLSLSHTQTHTHTQAMEGAWFCVKLRVEAKKAEVKPWWIFLCCNFAHNFLLNQKELGKHKHGLNYALSHGAAVGTDFLFLRRPSPSLWTWPRLSPHKQWQSQVPSCQLEENFALTYETRSGNRVLRGKVLIAVFKWPPT